MVLVFPSTAFDGGELAKYPLEKTGLFALIAVTAAKKK